MALIEALIESGHAYEASGDVYFSVESFPEYGKLSNRPLEEMQQGEGDDAAELKESPQDFALWKARKEGEDSWWAAMARRPCSSRSPHSSRASCAGPSIGRLPVPGGAPALTWVSPE